MSPPVRFGSSPLAVEVAEAPPYVVGQWIGTGPDGARGVAAEAAAELLARPVERLVLDLGRLSRASEGVAQELARVITEAQRLGRSVTLVRCSDTLYRRLRRAGAAGSITHAGSLHAATQGLAGEPTSTLDLHVRSTPELLSRLRSVVAALARKAHLSELTELQIKTAVNEAATNAIVHGSPEGPRNHVRVSFHLDPALFIVDVADQGPGFDPAAVPPPCLTELKEHGYGIHLMRKSMDRVEFYRDERGMLVRLTKRLGR